MEIQKNDIPRYKRILLDTLIAFDKLCKQHNLKYYVTAGTLLGAVRHQGFIPWDDDIDVMMFREDYNKLFALKDSLNNTDYELIDINDSHYYLPFGKFCNKNTTIMEVDKIPLILGVYLDIFIMDYTNLSETSYIRKKKVYSWVSSQFVICNMERPWNDLLLDCQKWDIKALGWHLLQKTIYKWVKPFFKWYLKYAISYQTSGRNVVFYSFMNRNIFDPSLFINPVQGLFEGYQIELPSGTDKFLTMLFGDYMQLPPVEKRQSHHSLYYYNLERRVSLKEIKSLTIE